MQRTPSAAVADEVRGQLAKNRISQATAGQHLGLSQAAMSRRISGEVPFDVVEIAKLADLLGVTRSVLMGESK